MATSPVGPSTPETLYLVPTAPGVGSTSIISACDGAVGATDPDGSARRITGAPGSSGRTEIVEGGRLMPMRVDADAAFA